MLGGGGSGVEGDAMTTTFKVKLRDFFPTSLHLQVF